MLYRSKINANSTISISARVSQMVLLWKASNGDNEKMELSWWIAANAAKGNG